MHAADQHHFKPESSLKGGAGFSASTAEAAAPSACHHCGLDCREEQHHKHDRVFCCRGCLMVFELLSDHGLHEFYQIGQATGFQPARPQPAADFGYLDDPAVRDRLVQFTNARLTRVIFRVPAIHCLACVWLLENLCRLHAGVLQSQVNFSRKEVEIQFANADLKLGELVALLASLGYAPDLKLSDLGRAAPAVPRRLWLQVGIAGFAFGNIMLFSLPGYFGLDAFTGPAFNHLFGWFSLVLALPVVTYSAQDYWLAAWRSLRRKRLAIEVPIALGLIALVAQSIGEVAAGSGPGYFDSLTGLLFFLLIGRIFQQKTYDRLSFDRDYQSFFPLAVTRMTATGSSGNRVEVRVSLDQLEVGDRLLIRNGELIPADCRLIAGPALIDYSFVTGESDPVRVDEAERLYAGGRQMGGSIEVELLRPVKQSYLTSLWNQPAFKKEKSRSIDSLLNRYSPRFTATVVGIAVMTALGWWWAGQGSLAIRSFTSVLIVACPCALALAAPFTLGTLLRVLGRKQIFLKGAGVIEDLARVDTVVFDKTGTLTQAGKGAVRFTGRSLSREEEGWLFSLSRHSTHPYSVRINEAIAGDHFPEPVRSFLETEGKGIEGQVAGHEIWMGSAAWLSGRGAVPPATPDRSDGIIEPDRLPGGEVHVAVDGRYRGRFSFQAEIRTNTAPMLKALSGRCGLALLSGDNPGERGVFEALLGSGAELHFNQSPLNKLEFIHGLQRRGRTVLMVGDGLNDAGALKQSDVGLAVVEQVSSFSPASDGILTAGQLPQLAALLAASRSAVRVVRLGFGISALYNAVGITVAAIGFLSPVVCAILMPVSSITVVAFSTGMAAWIGRRCGFENREVLP